MLRLTMLSRTVFLSALSVVFCDIFNGAIERKINATLKTTNTSDTALLLDIDTFVSYNGLRSGDSFLNSSISEYPPANSTKGSLRIYPVYFPPKLEPQKNKMLDLMRQAIYTTQERMENLIPILRRYENDASFRMAFIFNRLRQILIDMRRVYTLAWRSKKKTSPKVMRVYEQIFWYAHIVKKYFDVLYIVEYVIAFHEENAKVLL
ncbi:uncharacterized protein LOC116771590 isoform X2 [Danaus plexippus]|uniref:uncharacterized protein LOC116771590 isoform X2 n=1 Tax=Danaus plexippus TaxID=13037 RepID=UPI002AB0889E|nr:uncharacterized protein LOC116771590 isoform X2 [Danaus plexippus]